MHSLAGVDIITSKSRILPGMMPEEVVVLREWLKRHEGEYDRVFGNIRIGAGTDPGEGFPEEVRRGAILNTQKRIDALAYKGDQATIVEVKRRAGMSAVGQVLGYVQLYIAENPRMPAPSALLVAAAFDSDALTFAGSVRVATETIEGLFP